MASRVPVDGTPRTQGQSSPYPLIRSGFPGDDHTSRQTRKNLLDILLTAETIDFGNESLGVAFGEFVKRGYDDPTACGVLLEELGGFCQQLRDGFLRLETIRAELDVLRMEREADRS